MTVVVTGGAGFIASAFIFHTLSAHPEDRLVCIDSLTYAGHLSTLESVMDKKNFRFVRADITDHDAVDAVFSQEGPDIVVNFAAESHVDRSIASPGLFIRTNVGGVSNLMDLCLKHSVRRFHQVSTDEVYGDLPLDDRSIRFTEESPLRPSSPYSASKTAADLLALAYRRTYGLDVTVSRSSNNYGSHQMPEKLIPLAIINALEDRPVPVYGNGENVRDWIHVSDHCEAVDMIIRNARSGEVYNVGGGNEVRNIDIVRLILSILGKSGDLITFVPDRKGHDLRYALDSGKITKDLGWKPQKDFTQGLEETVRWYIDNVSWWQPLVSGSGS